MDRLKSVVLVGLALGIGGYGLPSLAAGPATKDLHITKECSGYTGDTPSFCTVTESNFEAIPKGTKIWYWGPDLGVADPVMTSSMGRSMRGWAISLRAIASSTSATGRIRWGCAASPRAAAHSRGSTP